MIFFRNFTCLKMSDIISRVLLVGELLGFLCNLHQLIVNVLQLLRHRHVGYRFPLVKVVKSKKDGFQRACESLYILK